MKIHILSLIQDALFYKKIFHDTFHTDHQNKSIKMHLRVSLLLIVVYI